MERKQNRAKFLTFAEFSGQLTIVDWLEENPSDPSCTDVEGSLGTSFSGRKIMGRFSVAK